MRTHTAALVACLGLLVMGAGPGGARSASAQVRSAAASVTLVARLDPSITIQYQSIPILSPYLETQSPPLELLHIVVQWRLRAGQSFQIQSVRGSGEGSASFPLPAGFVSLKQLAESNPQFAFAPSDENRMMVVAAEGLLEDEPVGRASLLLLVTPSDQPGNSTLHLRIAAP
jgi:hypothetical protein